MMQRLQTINRGVESAMHMVGLSYLDGYGTERDEGEARKWLALAAQAGYPPSVEMMGSMVGKQGAGDTGPRSREDRSRVRPGVRHLETNPTRTVII